MDPISGMVTTVQRPKKQKQNATTTTSSPSSTPPPPSSSSPTINPYEPKKPPERSGDLASRLAAAVNDKPRSPDMKKSNKDTTLPRTSTESANMSEPDVKKPAASEIANETTKALDDKEISPANEEDSETIATTPENEAAKDDGMAQLKEREEAKDDDDDDNQPSNEEQKGSEESIEKVEKEQEDQPVRMNQEDDVAEKDIKEDNVDMEAPTKSIEKSTNEGGSDEQQQQPATDDTSNQSVDIPEIKTDNKDTILQQREAQLFQAMQNIAQLHDQIHTLQEQADKDRRGYEDRIKELSSRPTAVSGGGDARSVKKLESTIEELQKQLKGKNEQIQGLMEEGIERWMETTRVCHVSHGHLNR